MSAPPPAEDFEDELLRVGELLLNGWGFNWYRAENLLRADDVLIRNHAESLLGEAESALNRALSAFRQKHLPPPSRAHPLPDPARLSEVRAMQALLAELDGLRTRLRGASMPPDDKIWRRHRDEADVLARLGRADAGLAGVTGTLKAQADATDLADLGEAPSRLAPLLEEFRRLLDRRVGLLAPPI